MLYVGLPDPRGSSENILLFLLIKIEGLRPRSF